MRGILVPFAEFRGSRNRQHDDSLPPPRLKDAGLGGGGVFPVPAAPSRNIMLCDTLTFTPRERNTMERIDPPAEKRGERSAEWRNRVLILKNNPGEFYKVGNYSPGVATHIRRGEYRAFLDPDNPPLNPEQAEAYMKRHWQITTRKTDEGGRNDVFIKWLG